MNSTNIIKGIRGKKNLSQENVADLLGTSRQTYNSLENDILNNDFTLVFKLLKLNEYEINEFFDALKQDYQSYKNKQINTE